MMMRLFADDMNVFLNAKNINTLIDIIQQEFSMLYIWLLAISFNNLKLIKT